ncbi:glycosyltransferase family 39 protein [Spirillospora albida]|uniref:glycosyltransferase family 39 protein n=1 Tax=Spirillospora albida TaxID=58123 RepID=UPI001FDFAC3F|nr:glycosyltransferase family 39 protein [Spirillospora albida]
MADDTSGAAAVARVRERGAALWALARRHPVFTVIIVMAAVLRGLAMAGYRPVMFFNDSFDYLHVAMDPFPHPLRPDGYSFLLILLKPFHSFALVAAVQHLMGLAMGVMIYALLRRKFRLPGWGAALAAAPVLLDAYQIQLEHLVLSDTMFTFLVMSAVTLLLWHDRPTWKIAAAVGLIIGMAWLTRSVGMPVLVGVLAYLLIRRSGWKILAVTMAACALPVLSYMGWYKVDSGKFAITESNGIFLYARVYKFADCHKMKDLPVSEYPLCTEPANRLPNSQDGIWNAGSPLNRYTGKRFSPENNKLGNDFAKRAITSQPGDYLQVVAHDFFRVFRWERTVFPDEATYAQYEFREEGNPLPDWRMGAHATASGEAREYENGDAQTRVAEPVAGVIRGYQDVFYLRGTMVGIILLIGLGGLLPLWRRLGGPALLPWTLATGLLLAPAATAEFDYRYVLPGVPLAALAAGMAFSPEVRRSLAGLRGRFRGPDTGEGAPSDVPVEPAARRIPEVAAK